MDSQQKVKKNVKKTLKLVFVGDGNVGKTYLLLTFVHRVFPSGYITTVFDQYSTDIEVDGKLIGLSLFDNIGSEDYDRLRPLFYPGADVMLICFRLRDNASFEGVTQKWFPEVHYHCPRVPIILVGTMKDLRADPADVLKKETTTSQTPNVPVSVSRAQGQKLAKKIGARAYVECSALTREGVREVFETAVRTGLAASRSTCVLL
jgi:small GTP-binding protein